MKKLLFILLPLFVLSSCEYLNPFDAESCFTVSKSKDGKIYVGDEVRFKSCSYSGYNLVWDFGDGTKVEGEPWQRDTVHVYTKPGFYEVKLQVNNNLVKDKTSEVIQVHEKLGSSNNGSDNTSDGVFLIDSVIIIESFQAVSPGTNVTFSLYYKNPESPYVYESDRFYSHNSYYPNILTSVPVRLSFDLSVSVNSPQEIILKSQHYAVEEQKRYDLRSYSISIPSIDSEVELYEQIMLTGESNSAIIGHYTK